MKVCKRGHVYRGDEDYRARSGRCPVCFRAVQQRYLKTDKAQAAQRRWLESDRGKETRRLANARTNARRIQVGDMYLGTCGFTVSQTEAMLDGSTDRP